MAPPLRRHRPWTVRYAGVALPTVAALMSLGPLGAVVVCVLAAAIVAAIL